MDSNPSRELMTRGGGEDDEVDDYVDNVGKIGAYSTLGSIVCQLRAKLLKLCAAPNPSRKS